MFSEELKTLPAVIAGISAAGAVRVGVKAVGRPCSGDAPLLHPRRAGDELGGSLR